MFSLILEAMDTEKISFMEGNHLKRKYSSYKNRPNKRSSGLFWPQSNF